MTWTVSRRNLTRSLVALPLVGVMSTRVWAEAMWQCQTTECGFIYNPLLGDPEHGIAPGTAFEDLPENWLCPNCGSPKSAYSLRG